MSFTDSIKNMFKVGNGNESNMIASLPISMAKPLEGTKVRFWIKEEMSLDSSKTTVNSSKIGEYKEGYFITENDTWAESEIFSWTKLTE